MSNQINSSYSIKSSEFIFELLWLNKTSENSCIFTAPTHAAKKNGINCLEGNEHIEFDHQDTFL